MSKRNLYPRSWLDRLLFWAVIIVVPSGVITLRLFKGGYFWMDWVSTPLAIIVGLALVYLLQDRPKHDPEDYTIVISSIERIGEQLSELATFLKRERERVSDAEATLRRLREEHANLEPLVLAEKDTVAAILRAHTRETEARAWKERALAFIIGVLASLLAAMVYEGLKRGKLW